MPPLADGESWSGDDSDGDCFTYMEENGTLTVTGLTAGGMEKTELTVPSAHAGVPVMAIAPGAFYGAEGLETLTVQQNVKTIGDGAFYSCTALRLIVLEQPIPAACRVGQGLLDGTDAKVYIPAEALSTYRTDYFWSVYGTSILAQ